MCILHNFSFIFCDHYTNLTKTVAFEKKLGYSEITKTIK